MPPSTRDEWESHENVILGTSMHSSGESNVGMPVVSTRGTLVNELQGT